MMTKDLKRWINDDAVMLQWSCVTTVAGRQQVTQRIHFTFGVPGGVETCLRDFIETIPTTPEFLRGIADRPDNFQIKQILFDPRIIADQLQMISIVDIDLHDYEGLLQDLAKEMVHSDTQTPAPTLGQINTVIQSQSNGDPEHLVQDWAAGKAMIIQWIYTPGRGPSQQGYVIDHNPRELVLKLIDNLRDTFPELREVDMLEIAKSSRLLLNKVCIDMSMFVGSGKGQIAPITYQAYSITGIVMQIIADDKPIVPAAEEEDKWGMAYAFQIYDKAKYVETLVITASSIEEAEMIAHSKKQYKSMTISKPRLVTITPKGGSL